MILGYRKKNILNIYRFETKENVFFIVRLEFKNINYLFFKVLVIVVFKNL